VVWLVHAIYHAELRHFVSARLTAAGALKRLEQSLLLFKRGGAHSHKPRPKRKSA
jgi:hypothetical protein